MSEREAPLPASTDTADGALEAETLADAASNHHAPEEAAQAEVEMIDSPPGAPAQEVEQNPALEQLPVEIEFSLGRIILSPAQLHGLAAGSVLAELPGLLFPKVQMMSAGRVFAEGELVEVSGRTGFRITRMLD